MATEAADGDGELTDAEIEELERLAKQDGTLGKIGRAWLRIEEADRDG